MKTIAIGPFGTAVLLAISIGVAGCAGDASRSPAAPTAETLVSSAHVSDSRHGGGNNTTQPAKETEFTGRAAALSGTCPALHLTIGGRSVSTTTSTAFEGVACAKLTVGQTVEVKGTLQSDGSVVATRIQVEAKEDDQENEGELRGAVIAETGTCPALTLTVGSATVKTTVATAFHDVLCTALTVGTEIEVKGAKQNDGSLLASTIERVRAE